MGTVRAFAKRPWNQLKPSLENVFWEFGKFWDDHGSKKRGNGPFQPFSRGVLGPTRGTVRAFAKRPWNQLKPSLENVF